MGILGARSLLDSDPNRYCETFRVNWDDDDSELQNQTKKKTKRTILLVDAMSLLYHCAMNSEGRSVHVSPATIRESVTAYVYKLLNVVNYNHNNANESTSSSGEGLNGSFGGSVHIFLDALSPIEKVPTQIDRSRIQAINGDTLARDGPSNPNMKVLHLLAEYAFVEAIEGLMSHPGFGSHLFIYRARKGEAEPYINHWLEQNSELSDDDEDIQVAILSDDSDFLVYPSCPGFVPLSSIQFAQHMGRPCMQGQHYVRSKFINSFLPTMTTTTGALLDTRIMTTVSALAGCDYSLGVDVERSLNKFRGYIIASDVGGLRQKVRNSPSAAAALTAILRYVAHHVQVATARGQEWLASMISDQPQDRQRNLLYAFNSIHEIYLTTLRISSEPDLEVNPGSVDVRRLLEYGMIYCPPLIETWSKNQKLEQDKKTPKKRPFEEDGNPEDCADLVDSSAYAIITSPPFTRQIATWMNCDSVWLMPHYRQIRARLYSVIRTKRMNDPSSASQSIDFDPVWGSGSPHIKEFVRCGTGRGISFQSLNIRIPDHEHVSTGIKSREILKQDELTIDRVLLFCLLGNPRQAGSAEKQAARRHGTLFLACLTLPYNLALLLILMGTAPALDGINLHPPASVDACNEVNEALPLLSVACFHALLLVNTVTALFGNSSDDLAMEVWEEESSTLASKVFVVSDAIRHDSALLIWQCLRLVTDNLEESSLEEGGNADHIEQYLDSAFDRLRHLQPENEVWREKLKVWKKLALPLWQTWWSTFNLDMSEKNVTSQ